MDPATQLALVAGVIGAVMAVIAMANTALMFWLNLLKERRADERAMAAELAAKEREQRNLTALRSVKDATDQQTTVVQKIGQNQAAIATAAATKVAEVAAVAVVATQVLAHNTADAGARLESMSGVLDVTHGLLNSAKLTLLKKDAATSRRLANMPTHTEADVVAADLADLLVQRHIEEQAAVDAEQTK